jgi:elongation factor G
VWRQADKYNVPRMIFVNKMDKMGADFYNSVETIKERLTDKAIPIELPNGASDTFAGVVSLVNMKYYTFEGEK